LLLLSFNIRTNHKINTALKENNHCNGIQLE
jgi:hypothetical protein